MTQDIWKLPFSILFLNSFTTFLTTKQPVAHVVSANEMDEAFMVDGENVKIYELKSPMTFGPRMPIMDPILNILSNGPILTFLAKWPNLNYLSFFMIALIINFRKKYQSFYYKKLVSLFTIRHYLFSLE